MIYNNGESNKINMFMGHQCNINKNRDYRQKSFKQLIIVLLRQSKILDNKDLFYIDKYEIFIDII